MSCFVCLLYSHTDWFSSALLSFSIKTRRKLSKSTWKLCLRSSFFSTLPRHKVKSACSGMGVHAVISQLVKKLDNKKKTIKLMQNQQPGEENRKPITELQGERKLGKIRERKRPGKETPQLSDLSRPFPWVVIGWYTFNRKSNIVRYEIHVNL